MNTINNPDFQACFVNTTNPPVKVIHLGWIAKVGLEEAQLSEIVEEWYPHPDAPDISFIQLVRIHIRETAKRGTGNAAKIELLHHAQTNIDGSVIAKNSEYR